MAYENKFEHKIGQGSFFNNDRKNTPNQPDFTGTYNDNGVIKRVAVWKKEGQRGTWYSLQVSEFQQTERRPEPAAPNYREQAAKPAPKANDDLPEWL